MAIIKDYFEIILAVIIFCMILVMKYDFYHILALLLELMVIIEVMQMLFVFFKKQRIKIRFMVDASIIFFIRELLIVVTTHKSLKIVMLYVGLIGVFFFFRYLALNVTYYDNDN
ncbi:MAG: phosphate-starvation-inducible PsiE family protein [Nautiliaceae bacterium]